MTLRCRFRKCFCLQGLPHYTLTRNSVRVSPDCCMLCLRYGPDGGGIRWVCIRQCDEMTPLSYSPKFYRQNGFTVIVYTLLRYITLPMCIQIPSRCSTPLFTNALLQGVKKLSDTDLAPLRVHFKYTIPNQIKSI